MDRMCETIVSVPVPWREEDWSSCDLERRGLPLVEDPDKPLVVVYIILCRYRGGSGYLRDGRRIGDVLYVIYTWGNNFWAVSLSPTFQSGDHNKILFGTIWVFRY
ncbi:hypothetical protein J6590_081086 [Homalodisca vitripennis]|nr:hypothetical protein J6590_081086 [Homalodisca vitripennis]